MASLAEVRVEEAEPMENESQARPEELRLLEALLFASNEPLDTATLAKRMPEGVDVKAALEQLQADYSLRGVNLVRVANKWTFRTAGDLAWLMTRESTETRRLSRAAIEVLAIIAYHQPVTRAEIEEIRGVVTSKGTAGRAAGNRLDQAARPSQDAGPSLDLRNHRGLPVAVHSGTARRSAGFGGAEGHGPSGFASADRIQRADAVG